MTKTALLGTLAPVRSNAPLDPVSPRANDILTGKYPAAPQIGTAVANYSNTISCEVASRIDGRKGGWGGARKIGQSRGSDGLRDRDVDDIIAAARFAFATGRTFQRHWIIHYSKAGIAETDATRFLGSILDQVAKQAKRDGGSLTALWVRECASTKGGHVHILLHLPISMDLRGRTVRWIENAGGDCIVGVSQIKIICGRLARTTTADTPTIERYQVNAMNVMRYLLKACDIETGKKLKLTRMGQGGHIIGKRRGWTQNIGAAARARATGQQ